MIRMFVWQEFLLPLHLGVLACTAIFVFLADHQGYLWFSGKKQVLEMRTLRRYHYAVLIGLLCMIAIGATMAWPVQNYLLQNPAFYIKMTFVATLFLNSFVIWKFIPISTTRAYATLSLREKIPLFVSSGISALCWVGAATTAFFLF